MMGWNLVEFLRLREMPIRSVAAVRRLVLGVGLGRIGGLYCRLRAARGRGADRGSGTILVVSLMGVIWLVAVTLMTAGGVRAARHRAHAAADMAALAAAERALGGQPDACRSAAKVARDMGVQLTRCVLSDGPSTSGTEVRQIADVSVTMTLRRLSLVGILRIPARARAGPVADAAGLLSDGHR